MKKGFRIGTGIIALIMTLMVFTGGAFASTTLQNGKYTIEGQAVNATTGAASMANDAIVKPLNLEVENGNVFVILEMANSMYDLAIEKKPGEFVKAEEIADNEANKTYTYKFQVAGIEEPALMQAVVGAMGRAVTFKLTFDKSTLVYVTQKTTTPAAGANPSTQTVTNTATSTSTPVAAGEVVNPKTSDNTFANLLNVILVALAMSIVIYGTHIIKNRKSAAN